MPRTRNFVLFLFAVMFLVWGISITLVRDLTAGPGDIVASALYATESSTEGGAILPEVPTESREARLEALRAKIASRTLGSTPVATVSANEETTIGEEPDEVEATTNDLPAGNLSCPPPTPVSGTGLVGVSFKEIIGQRIFYRVLPPPAVPQVSSTTASSTPPLPTEEVVLALPLRTSPLPSPSCITTDVVGVATDGSYIRNDEHPVYAVFGPDTLVGYALDGFPIFGKNDTIKTDSCGGATISGTYRYYLSSNRDSVLSCYSGIPARL